MRGWCLIEMPYVGRSALQYWNETVFCFFSLSSGLCFSLDFGVKLEDNRASFLVVDRISFFFSVLQHARFFFCFFFFLFLKLVDENCEQ